MSDCIFCKIGQGQARSWQVAENELAYAIFDIYPLSPWHTIVMPKNHYVNVFDLPLEDLQAIMALIKQITTLYHDKLGIHDLQILSNNGAKAQQDVFHSHWHIVPRFEGDKLGFTWKPMQVKPDRFHEMLTELNIGRFIDGPLS